MSKNTLRRVFNRTRAGANRTARRRRAAPGERPCIDNHIGSAGEKQRNLPMVRRRLSKRATMPRCSKASDRHHLTDPQKASAASGRCPATTTASRSAISTSRLSGGFRGIRSCAARRRTGRRGTAAAPRWRGGWRRRRRRAVGALEQTASMNLSKICGAHFKCLSPRKHRGRNGGLRPSKSGRGSVRETASGRGPPAGSAGTRAA